MDVQAGWVSSFELVSPVHTSFISSSPVFLTPLIPPLRVAWAFIRGICVISDAPVVLSGTGWCLTVGALDHGVLLGELPHAVGSPEFWVLLVVVEVRAKSEGARL